MKKAIPFAFVVLFVTSTSTAFANDGKDDKNTDHHATRPEAVAGHSSESGRNFAGWWHEFWDDLFGDGRHGRHDFHPNGSNGNGNSQGSTHAPGSNSAPIDGGLSFLLAAGVGLGVKKVRDRYRSAHPKAEADPAEL